MKMYLFTVQFDDSYEEIDIEARNDDQAWEKARAEYGRLYEGTGGVLRLRSVV